MANKVEVAITSTIFTINPGDTTEATVALRNLGQSVDQFTINIEGIGAEWYTLPVSSVALFPNDQDNLKIVLHPPKGTVKAGSYPFRMNVVSQENPEDTVATDLTIEVKALAEVELSLSPYSITGRKGLYRVTVKNPDAGSTMVHLEATDAEGILQYDLHPEMIEIPGKEQAESQLEVRLGWMAFFGGEKEFNFQVIARIMDVEETRSVDGQLVRVPWLQ